MSGRDPTAPTPESFQCPYADPPARACPAWRCDCFVATHPDDPFGLHPEAYLVEWPHVPDSDMPPGSRNG